MDLATLTQFSALIEKSGKRLMDTLTGVLNLSKLEAGEMNLGAGPVDLAEQAEKIAEELRPQAEGKGLALRVETGEGPIRARADAGGVQIVLRNLMSNAIKYTEEGEVRVRAYRKNSEAVLEVEDTGIGMDPSRAEDLFEPFRQAIRRTCPGLRGDLRHRAAAHSLTDERLSGPSPLPRQCLIPHAHPAPCGRIRGANRMTSTGDPRHQHVHIWKPPLSPVPPSSRMPRP